MATRREVLQIGLGGAFGLLGSRSTARPRARRVLILGGTGFIGPHLVHAALARGHQVSMLNRGQREPNQNSGDFARVEAIRGDRSQPDAYASLAGRTWDAVIDTAQQVPWTRAAVAALKGLAGRFMYVSSTGVFFPYRTIDIPENGPILLADTPKQDPPSYGVMKALSEQEVRNGFGKRGLIIRPGYIVGPGDTSDRFTYWPMRVARGGEVLVPGRPGDPVQYIDVRDLADWMIRLIEDDAGGTYNVVGPARKQTLEQFLAGLTPLAAVPVRYTWIADYAWLKRYPLRTQRDGTTTGLTEAIPWVMVEGTTSATCRSATGRRWRRASHAGRC